MNRMIRITYRGLQIMHTLDLAPGRHKLSVIQKSTLQEEH